MRSSDIFSVLCALAICAILPIASFAEPAPKNGDYKMISVSVAGHQELLCHRYMSGTDVNGRRYGLWSPTLQHNDPHCANLPAIAQPPPSNVRRLPAVPHGRPGQVVEFCATDNTIHTRAFQKNTGKQFDFSWDTNGASGNPCIPITTNVRSKKK